MQTVPLVNVGENQIHVVKRKYFMIANVIVRETRRLILRRGQNAKKEMEVGNGATANVNVNVT